MIHLIVFLILLSIVVRLVVRIAMSPFRYGGYRRRGYGYGCGCGRSYGGGALPLLGLLALGRLFGRRW
jgi:hypothetical protein